MLVICLRALILYFVVLAVTRLMGKRELGQMQPFELVISMLLANLASGPMADVGVPLHTGVLAILTLLLIHVLLAILIQKSSLLRSAVCGQPLILIDRGRINLEAMRRTRYNFDDLMEQLRSSGVFDAAQVEYAVLETDGSLSVLERAAPSGSAPADLPHLLVLDGKLQQPALAASGKSEKWLTEALHRLGYDSPAAVPYASLDGEGVLSVMAALPQGRGRQRP